MRKLTDFIYWVNQLKEISIADLRKLSDVIAEFCVSATGYKNIGILASEGENDGLHLTAYKGNISNFNDLDWVAIDSVTMDRNYLGEKSYIKLIADDSVNVIAVVCDKHEIDDQLVDVIRCAASLVHERFNFFKLKKRLAKSERIFNLTFEQVGCGRCVTDLEGYVLEVNQKFCDLIGYSQEEAMGLRIKHLTHPDDWSIDIVYKEQLLKAEIPYFSMEKRYFRKDGSTIWVYTTVTLMKDEDGDDDFLIGIVQDISAQKSADIEVLTGLYNRRYMLSKLQEEYNRSVRSEHPFSLIMTDIDYFKKINDDYGHDCGDEVLRGVSNVIKTAVRSLDVVCRWGGEEFLILLPDTDIESARQLADRIRILVSEEVFQYERKTFKLTMTFGVSTYSHDLNIKEIIKNADRALYRGKDLGRNIVI